MEFVGARTHRDADDAAGEAPVFGREAGCLDTKLFHRIERRTDLGTAVHGIAVADAIHVEVCLIAASSVDRRERAQPALALYVNARPPPIRHHAWDKIREAPEIPPRQRKVLDLLVDDHVALYGSALQVDGRRGRGDSDGLGYGTEFELDVYSEVLARLQLQIGSHEAVEAIGRDVQLVAAWNEAQQCKVTGFVGLHSRLYSCLKILDHDAGARYDGLGRIRNDTGDAGQIHLGRRPRTGQHNGKESEHPARPSIHVSSPCFRIPTPSRQGCGWRPSNKPQRIPARNLASLSREFLPQAAITGNNLGAGRPRRRVFVSER